MVGVPQICGVVGRRGHAHARMQKVELTLEQKVLIFGPIQAVRLGSVRPGGGAGAQGRRLTVMRPGGGAGARGRRLTAARRQHFLTRIGRLSTLNRSFYGLPAVGAAATQC